MSTPSLPTAENVRAPDDGLEDLAGAAARIDGERAGDAAAAAPGQAPAAAAIARVDDAAQVELEGREWAMLPAIFGRIISRAMPELAEHYADDKCAEWGRAMVPVARRHGWNVQGTFMYLGLALATWDMAAPTATAVIARRRAIAEAKGKAAGTGTVTAGQGAPAAPPHPSTVPVPVTVTDGGQGAPAAAP